MQPGDLVEGVEGDRGALAVELGPVDDGGRRRPLGLGVEAADQALYRAKSDGRNRVSVDGG